MSRYFVIDHGTSGNGFESLEDAAAHADRRGGLVVKLVGEVEKPVVNELEWSDADKLAYEREVKAAEAAWAKTNNQD